MSLIRITYATFSRCMSLNTYMNSTFPPCPQDTRVCGSICLSVCPSVSFSHTHTPFDKLGNDVWGMLSYTKASWEILILTLTHSFLDLAARCSHLGSFKYNPVAQVVPNAVKSEHFEAEVRQCLKRPGWSSVQLTLGTTICFEGRRKRTTSDNWWDLE